MGVNFEIACLTCKKALNLGKISFGNSTRFGSGNYPFYEFLNQHLSSYQAACSCCLIASYDTSAYEAPWYDDESGWTYTYLQNISDYNPSDTTNLPDGIRLYNPLGHYVEINQQQLIDMDEGIEFFGHTLSLKQPFLWAEHVNATPSPHTQPAPLERYELSFEIGCMQCNIFINLGGASAWEYDGLACEYSLLYSFLAEHLHDTHPALYVSSDYGEQKPWVIKETDSNNHCHPVWKCDRRSIHSYPACYYKTANPETPDKLPGTIMLKRDDLHSLILFKDKENNDCVIISDWLYANLKTLITIS